MEAGIGRAIMQASMELNVRKKSDKRTVLGLMAGTSGDGVDAACVEIRGKGKNMRARFLRHVHRRFPPELRRRIHDAFAPSPIGTEELARLHANLGDAFARAARHAIETADPGQRPEFVGLAGQTICHYPGRGRRSTVTLQLGDPARVAAHTGLPVVADFRQSDVAVGGQGAPLVPWTDWILFRDARVYRAIQNIGGVANVTGVPPNASPDEVIAFDSGPGNMVIDALAHHFTKGRQWMDRDGRMAARGKVIDTLLTAWQKHPYFRRKPPKTTGRETFGATFVNDALKIIRREKYADADVMATATALTARTIHDACLRFLAPRIREGAISRSHREKPGRRSVPFELIVAGGGARNRTLMRELERAFSPWPVIPMDATGWPVQAKEACSFALLAAARMDGEPANLPQVTGARREAVLGAVYLP